jgi:hypothetical protein
MSSRPRDVVCAIQRRVERELQGQGYPVMRSPYTFGFAAVHGIRVHDHGLDGGVSTRDNSKAAKHLSLGLCRQRNYADSLV